MLYEPKKCDSRSQFAYRPLVFHSSNVNGLVL